MNNITHERPGFSGRFIAGANQCPNLYAGRVLLQYKDLELKTDRRKEAKCSSALEA